MPSLPSSEDAPLPERGGLPFPRPLAVLFSPVSSLLFRPPSHPGELEPAIRKIQSTLTNDTGDVYITGLFNVHSINSYNINWAIELC